MSPQSTPPAAPVVNPPAADDIHEEKHRGFLSGLFGSGAKGKSKAGESPQDAGEKTVFNPDDSAPKPAVDAIAGPPGNNSPDVIAPAPVETPPAEDQHAELTEVENTTHDAEVAPEPPVTDATPEAEKEIEAELATGVESGTSTEPGAENGEKPVTIRIGGDAPTEASTESSSEAIAEPVSENASSEPAAEAEFPPPPVEAAPVTEETTTPETIPVIDTELLDPLANQDHAEEQVDKSVESDTISAIPETPAEESYHGASPEVEPTPDLTSPPHTPESVIDTQVVETQGTPENVLSLSEARAALDKAQEAIESARAALDQAA